jgi:transglutaminase-like putative cysteine protease
MIERRLQLSLISSATLAACMLGAAQRNLIIVVASLFAGVTSVLFTDILKWLILDRRVSYAAMIAAAVISLNGFWGNTSEDQLLAIANMLIFVQIALMYQEKTLRVYSHLAVFSVLQVVVAALLNIGDAFNVLLTFYVVTGSYAVMMYSMHRESLRLEGLQQSALASGALDSAGDDWRRAFGGGIQCRARVGQREASGAILNRSQAAQFASMAVAAVLFAAFFFFFSPRLGRSRWSPGGTTGRVGFNKRVSFRDLNRLVESNDVVMRVSFRDARTGEPYPLFGDPYFRGAALSDYSFSSRDPAWSISRRNSFWKQLPMATPTSDATELVRQEISLRPTSEDVLFGIPPFYGDARSPTWVNVDSSSNMLKMTSSNHNTDSSVRRYSIVTTGLQLGAQSQIIRQFHQSRSRGSANRTKDRIEDDFIDFDPLSCPTIQKVSDQLMAETADSANRVFRCQVLARYLLSAQFKYSLDTSHIRTISDPETDPVEDFFANHHTGFCGHFASALALMLRSQEIPARVVVGYKGGEFNKVGGYYLVRSRDAHAWVEAYLRPEDVVGISDREKRDLTSESGAWIRIDPTPGSALGEYDKGAMAYVDQVLDYSRTLWSDYVTDMSQKSSSSGSRARSSPPAAQDTRQQIGKWLQSVLPSWAWNVLGGLPLAGLLGVACWAVYNNLPRRRWQRAAKRRRKEQRRSPIAFYNRLETLAAKSKLSRRNHETPREFAAAIRSALAARDSHDSVFEALDRVITAFYEARFGGRALDNEETNAIEQALKCLDDALATRAS